MAGNPHRRQKSSPSAPNPYTPLDSSAESNTKCHDDKPDDSLIEPPSPEKKSGKDTKTDNPTHIEIPAQTGSSSPRTNGTDSQRSDSVDSDGSEGDFAGVGPGSVRGSLIPDDDAKSIQSLVETIANANASNVAAVETATRTLGKQCRSESHADEIIANHGHIALFKLLDEKLDFPGSLRQAAAETLGCLVLSERIADILGQAGVTKALVSELKKTQDITYQV